MKGRRLSFTMRYVLLFGILLFAANAVLGTVVLNQSKAAMRVLICKNMNDVSNSAAASLDADALASLTEDDVGGPVFNGIKDRLLVFQNSADIRYIYTVKRDGEGRFVFTVDPDPLELAAFGEEIVMTPALVEAASGVATVDDNKAALYPATLVVPQGVSCYMPGSDSSFKDVFARADEAMYGNKREYYRSLGIRSARD